MGEAGWARDRRRAGWGGVERPDGSGRNGEKGISGTGWDGDRLQEEDGKQCSWVRWDGAGIEGTEWEHVQQ